MRLKLGDACYKGIKGITKKEINQNESYQETVKEANRRIEESRDQKEELGKIRLPI